MAPDQFLEFFRFIFDFATLELTGFFLFLFLGFRQHPYTHMAIEQQVTKADLSALAAKLHNHTAHFHQMTAVALCVAALSFLPLQTANLGNGWADALNVSLMSDLIMQTRVGLGALIQSLLGLLSAISVLWLTVKSRNRASSPALGHFTRIILCLTLASLAISGHAAMQSGALGLLHQANHVVHLLSASFWLGGLVAILPLLTALNSYMKSKENASISAMLALMHYSTLGHFAVALVIITGVMNAIFIRGTALFSLDSPYMQLLWLKIALVFLMTSIAIINRYVFVPHIHTAHHKNITNIIRGTWLEIAAACAILALVATFGMMDPGA